MSVSGSERDALPPESLIEADHELVNVAVGGGGSDSLVVSVRLAVSETDNDAVTDADSPLDDTETFADVDVDAV